MLTEIIVIVLLTLANGVFSGAEIAILSTRKTRLRELVENGSTRAVAVRSLREKPEVFLATVQIGITVIGATAAAFGGATIAARLAPILTKAGFGQYADEVALGIVVSQVSFLSLVLGELIPKSIGLRFAETYALAVGKPLLGLAFLARPLVWSLTWSSNLVLRMFGDSTSFTESRLSPEELRLLVEEATTAGTVDQSAGEIAARALDMGKLTASQVMVPRRDMVGLERSMTDAELRKVVEKRVHGRFPVYESTLENVVGYVTAVDLLTSLCRGETLDIGKMMRPAYFVPEAMHAVDVLRGLQKAKTHLSLVVDEHGSVVGLLTIEDLLEEMVGEIFGESDDGEGGIVEESAGIVRARGDVALRDLNRRFDFDLPEHADYSTIAGLAIALAGGIPKAGTRLKSPRGEELEVLEASPRRVLAVRVRVREAAAS